MPDLTDDQLTALEKHYRDRTPGRACHVCGSKEWALAAAGGGRVTWVCKRASEARPMDWDHYSATSHEVMAGDEEVIALVAEIRRHRSALAADRERVQSVVAKAVLSVQQGHPGTDVWYPRDFADHVATRAAEQLATSAVLTPDERDDIGAVLNSLAEQREAAIGSNQHHTADMLRDQHAALTRLLAGRR